MRLYQFLAFTCLVEGTGSNRQLEASGQFLKTRQIRCTPEAFTEDLVELAQAEGVIPRPERSDSSPSPGVAAGLVAMLGAALLLERRRS